MSAKDYAVTFTVTQSPEEVFNAITNVRGWWSEEIVGETARLGALFTFQYRDLHRTTQKITELTPGKKVVWSIVESDIGFVVDRAEWLGTEVVFEITRRGNRTELRFEHMGLVPTIECYEGCSGAWEFYIRKSLQGLITSGKGQPNKAAAAA
jgi:uncharacterized protein YndB with AHSA1/START domain